MDNNDFFNQQLSTFTRDFAYGGAIRHLVDNGYDTDMIIKKYNYPLPREAIDKIVNDYKKQKGIL